MQRVTVVVSETLMLPPYGSLSADGYLACSCCNAETRARAASVIVRNKPGTEMLADRLAGEGARAPVKRHAHSRDATLERLCHKIVRHRLRHPGPYEIAGCEVPPK